MDGQNPHVRRRRARGRVPERGIRAVRIAGRGDVPAGASAALVNVTVVGAAAPGYVTLFPCGAERPTASTVNYVPGRAVPNGALAKLSPAGELCVFSLAEADVIVDVSGYIPDSASVVPETPARLFDFRPGEPLVDGASVGSRLRAGGVIEIQVTGRADVPETATAAFLNVVAVDPDGSGYVTLFPCTDEPPLTSNLNYVAGDVRANNAAVQLSPAGTVCAFTLAGTDLVIDVNGYAA